MFKNKTIFGFLVFIFFNTIGMDKGVNKYKQKSLGFRAIHLNNVLLSNQPSSSIMKNTNLTSTFNNVLRQSRSCYKQKTQSFKPVIYKTPKKVQFSPIVFKSPKRKQFSPTIYKSPTTKSYKSKVVFDNPVDNDAKRKTGACVFNFVQDGRVAHPTEYYYSVENTTGNVYFAYKYVDNGIQYAYSESTNKSVHRTQGVISNVSQEQVNLIDPEKFMKLVKSKFHNEQKAVSLHAKLVAYDLTKPTLYRIFSEKTDEEFIKKSLRQNISSQSSEKEEFATCVQEGIANGSLLIKTETSNTDQASKTQFNTPPKVKNSKKNKHIKQKTKQEKDEYHRPSHHRYQGNIKSLSRPTDVELNSNYITLSPSGRDFTAEAHAKNAKVKTYDEMPYQERRADWEELQERYAGAPIQNNSGFPYVVSRPKAKPVAPIKSVALAKTQKVSEKDQTSEAKIISNVGTTLEKELQELDKLEHSLDNMSFVKTAKNSTLEESIETSKLEQEIQRKKQEQERKRIEKLNSPENIAKTAETLCKNKKKENRYSDSVSPNSQRHIQSLKKISAALKKLSDPNTDQKWYEQYQDREYDVSNIDPNILHALGLDFNKERLFNATEPQDEMMKVVLSHTKDIEKTLARYSGKESVQRLTNKNMECLKEAVECIKANRLGEAFIALEKSWALQDLTRDTCFGYELIHKSKVFSKGLYSGVKRAINIPQRVVDLYHTGKALGKVFSRLAEIDELVHRGEIKEAEAKYEALKKDIVTVWENIKERISNASGDDIAFFFGELVGDFGTSKLLSKNVAKAVKYLKPKVANGVNKCFKKTEEWLERVRKNPETTLAEGSIEIEIGKKAKGVVKNTSKSVITEEIKLKALRLTKKEMKRLASKSARISGITIDTVKGKIKINIDVVQKIYGDKFKKLGLNCIAKRCLKHIRNGHYQDGSNFIMNYIKDGIKDAYFNQGENFIELMLEAYGKGTKISANKIVYDFGRTIGMDRMENATSMVEVWLNSPDAIRTFYPVPMK